MELAYSGLHQLCLPLLGDLDRLPVPQRNALTTIFGLSPGPPPQGLLVGLAMLTLMADSAEDQPVMCVVDDAHWLDKASAQILGFVGRRLLAERIVMAFAARTDACDDDLADLPGLSVRGLQRHDPRALLLANLKGPLDAAVCEQIVSESHGNPLVLLEFPRTWGSADLQGGFGVPDSRPRPASRRASGNESPPFRTTHGDSWSSPRPTPSAAQRSWLAPRRSLASISGSPTQRSLPDS